MRWDDVTKTEKKKLEYCAEFFKASASTQNKHLNPGHLISKLNAKVLLMEDEYLFKLYLYDKSTDNSGDYRIVVGFDLSIHRASRPLGPIQKWDWCIHVGVKAFSEMSDEEVYKAVKDKCREFLGNPPSKALFVIGDASSAGGDPLITMLRADNDVSIGRVLYEPVAGYHYYRQPRHGSGSSKPEGGLGTNGVLARQQIFSIK